MPRISATFSSVTNIESITMRSGMSSPAHAFAAVTRCSGAVIRHTFVTLWVAAGVNPKELSVRAGHLSVAFTLDRYGHLYEDAGEDIPDRLDALLGGRATPRAFPNRGTQSPAIPRSRARPGLLKSGPNGI